MADRFPLIVNATSRKIEELVAGDNLDLTGNGISVSGNTGNTGQYLKVDSGVVTWDNPGDVYTTAVQSLENKTFLTCIIDAASNILTNIPNSSLANSSITVNGTQVALGGSVTTADVDTTYDLAADDGSTSLTKKIQLTDNLGNTDEIIVGVGSPSSVPGGSNALNLEVSRVNNVITFAGTVVDSDTITTLQAATGGQAQSGAMIFAGTGGATVSQDTGTKTITINSLNDDTITRFRGGSGQVFNSGDYTLLAGSQVTISQAPNPTTSDPEITISSVDTITRVKGGVSGSFQSGDISITGGSNVTVSQVSNTIEIQSQNDDTITKVASGSEVLASGNFRLKSAGATTLSQTTNSGTGEIEIEISSANTDTGATLSAGEGILLASSEFSIKNAPNLVDNRVSKWDNTNAQFANSIITDDGSTITINGDFQVTGSNTIINTTTLQVQDNTIEVRTGNSITGGDGGLQVNRTTDANGAVATFNRLEWYEAGAYWRSFDNGGIAKRLVTENEVQTLSNKTLNAPVMTGPTLGTATATTINGLSITATAGSTFAIADLKTVSINNTLTFSGTDGANINFGNGGGAGSSVAFTSNTLGTFAVTTSTQLRGVVSDSTGTGSLVFAQNPVFLNSITTSSNSLNVFNTSVLSLNFAGSATAIEIGASSGTTSINNSLEVDNNVILGSTISNTLLVNGVANFDNADILIRNTGGFGIGVGRGGGQVQTNTRVGYATLASNQSGSQNTAFGYSTLQSVVSGASNTGVGYRALGSLDVGSNNNAIGKDSQFNNDTGIGNVSIGNSSLENNTDGDYNVCLGHYAGYAMSGSGNVLIGPATTENSTSSTYAAASSSGDNQLVIGSGVGTWITGNSAFDITLPNDLRVNGTATIDGDLIVQGTTTSVNSNVVTIDDKAIELAAVTNQTFIANYTNGSANITNINPKFGLIPGMTITSPAGGATVTGGTYIVTFDGVAGTATLSNAITGATSDSTFIATGPTDLGADGGGIIIKGTPVSGGGTGDKTILYDHSRTDKYFVSTENFEIGTGKKFSIGNQLVLNSTDLGNSVVNSSLTSVGTLTSLDVDGPIVLGGRTIEKVFSNFSTQFNMNGSELPIQTAAANTLVGTTPTSPINTWDFNTADPSGVTLQNGQSVTISVIIDANTAAIYGDACNVDGVAVSTGVKWSGGSPPIATTNTDILTFIIVKDTSGVTQVFGQGNTDFS